jgi:hypothetical protein
MAAVALDSGGRDMAGQNYRSVNLSGQALQWTDERAHLAAFDLVASKKVDSHVERDVAW